MMLSNICSNVSSGVQKAWNYAKENPKKIALLAAGVSLVAYQTIWHTNKLSQINSLLRSNCNELTSVNFSGEHDGQTFYIVEGSCRAGDFFTDRIPCSEGFKCFLSKLVPDFILPQASAIEFDGCTTKGWFQEERCIPFATNIFIRALPTPISDYFSSLVYT